jgi:hypothetical protein
MKSNAEKRACERHHYAADIAFSYFNKTPSYHAEILNLGLNGMCFKSNLRLHPEATVCIRLTKIHPDGSGPGFCQGLRSVTLAEVRWCSEMPGVTALSYGVGVKYFNPVY